jgi:hypothetical protein
MTPDSWAVTVSDEGDGEPESPRDVGGLVETVPEGSVDVLEPAGSDVARPVVDSSGEASTPDTEEPDGAAGAESAAGAASSADATPGPAPRSPPTPSATARAPTRPMYLA